MSHNHQHDHSHGKNASLKILFIAIIIIFAYAIVEAVTGWFSGSLALLGDAGHMLSDTFALMIAAFAAWIAKKPPSKTHSFGMGRAEVVAALFSSILLLLISAAVIVEAVQRLHEPVNVKPGPVMLVAFLGMIINIVVAFILAKSERTLNMRAALLHVLSDLLGSFAALIAGAVIYTTHWVPIDPILSILIGVLIAVSSLRILKETLRILMEGVPVHINIESVAEKIKATRGVLNTHDLHIWTLSSGSIALSAHVDIHEISEWPSILDSLTKLLDESFQIQHITLQPEPEVFDCNPCQLPV